MKPQIGSISHGTLRTQDLLEAFSSALEAFSGEGDHRKLIQEAHAVILLDSLGYRVAETEKAIELLANLEEALGEYAPEGCYFGTIKYFGTTEGKGSDFGFWPINY